MANGKSKKPAGYLFLLAGLLILFGAYASGETSLYGAGVVFLGVAPIFLRNPKE